MVEGKFERGVLGLNKLLALAIAIAAIAVAAYYAGLFGGVSGPLAGFFTQQNAFVEASQARARVYGEAHATEMLSYTHPNWGYTVKYPVGYYAEAEPDFDTSFRATANSPVSTAELIEVRVAERVFTEKDFEDAASAFGEGELVSRYSGSSNGKKIFVFQSKSASPETQEKISLRTAVYSECVAPDGTRYTAVLLALVPDVLGEDLDLADYAIYSFTC